MLQLIEFALAVAVVLVVAGILLEFLRALRATPALEQVEVPVERSLPPLSIVVAARNEQRDVERSVRSLLAQDYEPLELIAVNDRSTDDTGRLLEALARSDPRLRVVHVAELPAGWLGKNHALHVGAGEACGELLLVTDADVVFAPTTLRRAAAYLLDNRLDHLALMPRLELPGILLGSFGALFVILFTVYFRPWRAPDPRSKAHVGIGAFNLLRREVYRNIGGHAPIAMRPDDDLKLGQLVKRRGYRQQALSAVDLLRVPWYRTVGELIRGLEKNAFAGLEYSVGRTVASSIAALAIGPWPLAALALTDGWTRALYALAAALLIVAGLVAARQQRLPLRCAPLLPLAIVLLVYIQWRTMLLTLWQGGIRWRDTFYPLDQLR